jgi:dipeptidyl aminopeptidase/acylaminoacyl peptidase
MLGAIWIVLFRRHAILEREGESKEMNTVINPRSLCLGLSAGFLLSLLSAPVLAQRGGFGIDPRAEDRSYHFADADEDMPYCVFASSKVDPDTPAPLVLTLHGAGAGPQIMCNSTAVGFAEEGGYILASPMGYSPTGGYGSPRMGGRGGGDGAPANLSELSEKDVMNVLAMVRAEFNIDDSRIYLTGHSMGGGGTMHLGPKYADIWAAIAPVAGGGRDIQPEALQRLLDEGVAVMVVHGADDEVVPVESARALVDALEEMGIEHEYVELPGISHGPVITASQEHVFEFFGKHSK